MFYLHIPKTGGQSLTRRLASAFTPQDVHFFEKTLEHPKDVDTLRSLLQKKKFIESHVAGRLLETFPDLDILATVRDPVGQMVSNWRHIRREPANLWHRAARTLTPGQFFDNFGDFFTDHQTTYLLSAFVWLRPLILRLGYHRALHEYFFQSIDKIRWLVPAESIDEFVGLWAIETKRNVPNRTETINVAPSNDEEVATARAAVIARPHLYAFDQLLYQVSKQRFSAYKNEVSASLVPWSYPDDSRRAYCEGTSGVWLTENWYDPEIVDEQSAWWSGPQRNSEIRVRRANGEKFLSFHVRGVNGITYNDILPMTKGTFELLPTTRSPHPSGTGTNYMVELRSLQNEGAVVLLVPNCMASIMTTTSDNSLVRRSFIALDWKLRSSL